MAIVHEQMCPNKKCKTLTEVYIDQDRLPSMFKMFKYTCPDCKMEIAFPAGAFVLNQKIPPGATVVVPVEG